MIFYFYQIKYKHSNQNIISAHQTMIENYIISKFDKYPLILQDDDKTILITTYQCSITSKDIDVIRIGLWNSTDFQNERK